MKALVICPRCEAVGRKQVLGELKDGALWIMRFHSNFTVIRGEFEVLCSYCNEPVYFKTERRPDGTLSNLGGTWLFGVTPIPEAVTLGTESHGTTAGTIT